MAEIQQASPDGGSTYSEADAVDLCRHQAAWEADRERRLRIEATGGGYAAFECTCKGSPFGMDVEQCPRHGN